MRISDVNQTCLLNILKNQLVGKKLKLIDKKEDLFKICHVSYQRGGKTLIRIQKKKIGTNTTFKILTIIDIKIFQGYYDEQDEINLILEDSTHIGLSLEEPLEIIDPIFGIYMRDKK